MSHENELMIPSNVQLDKEAFEVIRIWVSQKTQVISIATNVWNDPLSWGIMLVDMMKHISRTVNRCRS